MIAANGATARFLAGEGLRRRCGAWCARPSAGRSIVAVAAEQGERLPPEPDAAALEAFLMRAPPRPIPLRFPDLSLVIVKLHGRGRVRRRAAGPEAPTGHFGLAVRDYTHSTAPNRRFPDLITQRLDQGRARRAAARLRRRRARSSSRAHCTEQEDDANKVERQVRKSAAALLLEGRIGERFDGVVTGASDKGTWVRIFQPPAEGKLVHGFEGLEVGDKLRVKLISTDFERGFIDFVRVG